MKTQVVIPQHVMVKALGLNPTTEILDIDLSGSEVVMTVKESMAMPTEKCLGCGWHMAPQSDGGYVNWEECQNPNCDYEEGDSES